MLEVLQRFFFSLFVFGIFAFLSWATWDTDNIAAIVLTLVAGLIAWIALGKEQKRILARLKEIEENNDE